MSSRTVSLAEIETAYRSHAHHVHRRAKRILGNEGDASEVVQEVFLSLVDRPEQFAAQSALTTWLYSATVHRCLNRLRNERNRARLIAERSKMLEPSTHATPADDAVELRSLLVRLPDDLVRLAVFQLADEMTQEEMAEVMGCSRRRVRKDLERLQRVLAVERARGS